MYKEIYDYAVKNNIVSVPNSTLKEIAAYINLDANGTFIGIDVIDKNNRKKIICPDIGSLAFAGNNANPIVEKRLFIFDKNEKKHSGWISIMKDGSKHNAILAKIYSFIETVEKNNQLIVDINQKLDDAKIKPKDFISFRIADKNGEDQDVWTNWLSEYLTKNSNYVDSIKIVSSLTGNSVESVSVTKAPQVKASATGTGAYVTAIAAPSFESYGLAGNIGASIGAEEALDIKSGLEFLLSSKEHFDSRFSLLHWYENEEDIEDLITESLLLKDDDNDEDDLIEKDRELGHLLQCAITGEKPAFLPDTSYFFCQFIVPTKGRQFISNKYTGTYKDLYNNLSLWYRDSSIKLYDNKLKAFSYKILTNIYSIFFALMSDSELSSSDKYKKLEAKFGNTKIELLNSIYSGNQIPRNFYVYALAKYTNSIISGKKQSIQIIQIIKIYLIRLKREENRMDSEKETTAYACGELFAIYERIQNIASGNLNVNVTEKYFSAVQKAPQIFFPKLADLSIVHMKKINKESTKIWLNKQIGEATEKIGTSFPQKMNDIEKGEFILGYYNKKTELFSKSDNVNNVLELKED